MSAWSQSFDDELEKIGYRVLWEANGNYTVYAPGEKYISTNRNLQDARTAAYNHWQKSNSPVEKLSQEISHLHDELNARQAEIDRLLQAQHEQAITIELKIERVERLEAELKKIGELADVGSIFDGHDECNEFTHEENEKLLTAALDRIRSCVDALCILKA